MNDSDPLFLDTVFIQALLNRRDRYHAEAKRLSYRLRTASVVWVTEAIFLELAAALSAIDRQTASSFIRLAYTTGNLKVASIDSPLFFRALSLYESRPDKQWSLVDCISFIVMQDQGLKLALTADKHFVQAGFQTLMTQPK